MTDVNEEIRTAVIKKLKVSSMVITSQELLDSCRIAQSVDFIANGLVTRLTAYLAAVGEDYIDVTVKHPDGWWNAVKEDLFPRSLKRWFPVKYKEHHIHEPRYKAVCPHTTLDSRQHIDWLREQGNYEE